MKKDARDFLCVYYQLAQDLKCHEITRYDTKRHDTICICQNMTVALLVRDCPQYDTI